MRVGTNGIWVFGHKAQISMDAFHSPHTPDTIYLLTDQEVQLFDRALTHYWTPFRALELVAAIEPAVRVSAALTEISRIRCQVEWMEDKARADLEHRGDAEKPLDCTSSSLELTYRRLVWSCKHLGNHIKDG